MENGSKPLRLLHTSDWHIGHTLYGRKRHDEFGAFLDWLGEVLVREDIDVLLVAGDIFDSSVPSHRAQELYYRFLHRITLSSCRHAVLVGGNHDSPTFLDAPQELLGAFSIHVVGTPPLRWEDEVKILRDSQGRPELLVCAVPYLRDGDLRTAEAGESPEDKDRKLVEGLRSHYAQVVALGEEIRQREAPGVPLVALGHLFVAGGTSAEGDGVRELYVGSLARVSGDIFPENLDYVALGHLHAPQKVAGAENRRYSGAPLALGFGEATQKKSLCRVEFSGRRASVDLLPVPVFQRLERLRGSPEEMLCRLRHLATEGESVWLEADYDGEEILGDLGASLDSAVLGTPLEVLCVKNRRLPASLIVGEEDGGNLTELNEHEVFERCLEEASVGESQREELRRTYREILLDLAQDDPLGEERSDACASSEYTSKI